MSSYARLVEGYWDAIEAESDPVARQVLERELAEWLESQGWSDGAGKVAAWVNVWQGAARGK